MGKNGCKDGIAIVLLAISQLLLCDVKVAGVGIYSVVLLLFAVISLFLHISNGMQDTVTLVKKKNKLTCLSLSILLWEVIRLIYAAMQSITSEVVEFERELNIIAIVILFNVYRQGIMLKKRHLNIMIITGMITSAVGLAYHITAAEMLLKIIPLVVHKYEWTAYLIVLVMLADLRLRDVRTEKVWRYVYITALALDYVLLVLSGDWLGVCILIGYYLIQPVLLLPTKSLVDLSGKQLFALLFTVSNMSLVTGYTGLIKNGIELSLEASIYVDIITAVCGLVFFTYWERVPEKAPAERLVLRRMREGYKIAFVFYILMVLAIISSRGLIHPDENAVSGNGSAQIIESVAESFASRGNIPIQMYMSGDVIGALMLSVLVVFLVYRALKRMSLYSPQISGYALISAVGLITCMSAGAGVWTVVILEIIALVAAFGPKDEIHFRKRKYVPEEIEETEELDGGLL